MKLQLSDKAIRRIAKSVKGQEDLGKLELYDYEVSNEYETGRFFFTDDMSIEGRVDYWVLTDMYNNEVDTYQTPEEVPKEYLKVIRDAGFDLEEIL